MTNVNYDLKYNELLLEELKQSTCLFDSMDILKKRQVFLSFEKGFIILNIIKVLFKQYGLNPFWIDFIIKTCIVIENQLLQYYVRKAKKNITTCSLESICFGDELYV